MDRRRAARVIVLACSYLMYCRMRNSRRNSLVAADVARYDSDSSYASSLPDADPAPETLTEPEPETSFRHLTTSSHPPLPDLTKIESQARHLSTYSWELGTLSHALLSLHSPSLTVFSPLAFPNDALPTASSLATAPGLIYARAFIRTERPGHPPPRTLMHDAFSVADPAALGVAAVMLGRLDEAYMRAAERQRTYLLETAPRAVGAGLETTVVCHRLGPAREVWADGVSMVPPFLAYMAVARGDLDGLREVVRMCAGYREVLEIHGTIDEGLWRHIVGSVDVGEDEDAMQDLESWATGNAWAAMGLARVAATIKHWRPAREQMAAELEEVLEWAMEIVDAVIGEDVDRSGLLRNYLGGDDASWFGDVSATALMAAAVYRLVVLAPDMFDETMDRKYTEYIQWAHAKRLEVFRRIDDQGIAKPAVQPMKHSLREPLMTGSPEGQSFVLELAAAWRDWSYAVGQEE